VNLKQVGCIVTVIIMFLSVVGDTQLDNESFGGRMELDVPTSFVVNVTFGGRLEIEAQQKYYANISNDGYDYFCWKGENGTLSDVADNMSGFDSASEFIAVWNATNWTTNEGCWQKYYGDGSGNDAEVTKLDVIRTYLADTGRQQINMTSTDIISCARTVDLHFLGSDINKGYNYTCYCCDIKDLYNLSTIASAIPLQTGEVLSWWDNSTQQWRAWIVGISHTDYNYTVNVTSPIFETKIHTNVSWVISCP